MAFGEEAAEVPAGQPPTTKSYLDPISAVLSLRDYSKGLKLPTPSQQDSPINCVLEGRNNTTIATDMSFVPGSAYAWQIKSSQRPEGRYTTSNPVFQVEETEAQKA